MKNLSKIPTKKLQSEKKRKKARVFEDMKTKEYKVLKKQINDIYVILTF